MTPYPQRACSRCLPALSAHTHCLTTTLVSHRHRPPDLVGCLCRPTHSRHFRRQSSLAVHCPHYRRFDVFVVRQTFCRATEVLCRPSSSLSWSYCCHVSHRTAASRQDSQHCRVAPGGSPCPAHPNMLLWGQLRRCKARWMWRLSTNLYNLGEVQGRVDSQPALPLPRMR